MSENDVRIDYANLPTTPADGFLVTLFITACKIARSRTFYSEVLGGTVVLEENPCIVRLVNSNRHRCRRRGDSGRWKCS
jgi:hypothetical protein